MSSILLTESKGTFGSTCIGDTLICLFNETFLDIYCTSQSHTCVCVCFMYNTVFIFTYFGVSSLLQVHFFCHKQQRQQDHRHSAQHLNLHMAMTVSSVAGQVGLQFTTSACHCGTVSNC